MYSKIVWCYTVILMLLNISPNTKLTAQGNSHGGSAQDTLMEGFNFQEWGKDDAGSASGAGVMSGGVAAGVRLRPAVLSFGRRALGAAHTATVTLRNTANTTLHLASVAGTTPDFHASFFDNKSVPPDGNTTFSVVYAGRRLGPAAAQLYIHTSRGVRKYQVSAEGVASAWGVWPVLGVRAPHNATLEPVLAITNPTDTPVQVLEVYSSGAWLGLQLPGAGAGDGAGGGAGAESAPRAAWLVPPRQRRDIVRMRINMPEQQTQPLVAYIRIKTNASQAGGGGGGDGGGLLVAVEARGAPAGEHARPLQLRLSARGADDKPDTFELEVGNSRGVEATLSGAARVRGARCHARPGLEPDSLEDYRDNNNANGNGQGVHTSGASVTVSRPVLGAHQPPAPAAKLTLDYGKLWAEYSAGAGLGSAGAGAGAAAYCSGWVSLGAAAVPYSVRVEPGTLRMLPDTVRVVTSLADAGREHEVRVHNQFARDVRVLHVEMDKLAEEYFHVHSPAPLWVGAGRSAVVLRVRARAEALADAARTQQPHARPLAVDARVRVLTDGQAYTVTLLMYTGLMHMEWQWPNSADGWLRVGAVGTSQTRRVGARLHNPAPARLCARDLRALLPGAQLALEQCAQHGDTHAEHSCRCVGAGQWAQAWLTVVAPAREGALHGAVLAATEHGARVHNVSLRALQGRLHALPLHLPDAAPYSWAEAELVLESSMSMRMRVVKVEPAGAGAGGAHDAALQFLPGVGEGDVEGEGEWVESGRRAVGRVRYMPEAVCAPACYTGLDVTTPEGLAWLWRAPHADEQALRADAALLRERARMYSPQHRNITLLVHTDQVVQVTAEGWARLRWARLAGGGARAGWAGLAGVGGAVTLRLPARNPSRSHHVLLHAALGPPLPLPPLALTESSYCGGDSEPCSYSASSFRLSEWRAVRGEARPYHWEGAGAGGGAGGAEGGLPVLVLAPGAEVELRVVFAPHAPAPLTAYLYLRNNLTILEAVQLAGRGAHASFELGGLRPGEDEPLVLEASECGGGARLTVTARNTGRVAVRLREWRVSGQPCAARGFRVTPCQPQPLAPNESRALTLAFAPDWTVARARARLTVRTDTGAHAFPLLGLAPARLLPRCLAHQPRPPFEPRLRLAARLLALAVLALVLAAAALDAERLLRRARAARAPQHAPHCPRAPLDLRALAAQHDRPPAPPAPAPASAPAPAHPAARRRRARKPDPHAESRAFERWRDSLRRRDDRDEDRSSEDADEPAPPDTDCDTPAGGLLAGGRAYPRRPPPDRPPPDDRPGPGPRPDDRPPSSAEDRPPSSADERAPSSADDVSTTGSGRSTPPDRASDDNDPDDIDIDDRPGDDLADERESLPKSPGPSPGPPPPRAPRTPPPGEAAPRGGRPRRDPPDAPRRPDRRRTPRPAAPHTPAPAGPTPTPTPTAAESELEAEAPAPSGSGRRGPTHGRPHSRKDKAGKRRDRPPATPPQRDSPAPAAGGPGAGAGGAEGRAGSVRAGALWSSVVALGTPAPSPAPAPLPAPIGSDLRRRRDPPAPAHPPARAQDDHSLFYFNGERAPLAPAPLCPAPAPARTGLSPVCGAPAGLVRPEPEYAWRAPSFTPPPLREYLGEGGAPAEGHFGTIGSVWGAGAGAGAAGPAGGAGAGPGAAWPWGAYSPRDTEPRRAPGSGGVRPPPGFGATPGVLPAGAGGGAGAAPGVSGGAAGGAGAGVGAGAEAGRVRAFDPFHSLASIWTRTALDWRRDDHSDPDRDDDDSHADQ